MSAKQRRSDATAAPPLIVPMRLQPAIPRRVALQQSSLPLHRPGHILQETEQQKKKIPLNGKCASFICLSTGVHPKEWLCYGSNPNTATLFVVAAKTLPSAIIGVMYL